VRIVPSVPNDLKVEFQTPTVRGMDEGKGTEAVVDVGLEDDVLGLCIGIGESTRLVACPLDLLPLFGGENGHGGAHCCLDVRISASSTGMPTFKTLSLKCPVWRQLAGSWRYLPSARAMTLGGPMVRSWHLRRLLIRHRTLDPEEGQDHQFPVADVVKRVRGTSKVLEPESGDGGRISGRLLPERGQEDKQGSEVRYDQLPPGIIGPIEEWDQLGTSSTNHICRVERDLGMFKSITCYYFIFVHI
jgi:hypothetical protein